MSNDRVKNFLGHSIFLSEIAIEILKENSQVLNEPGLKEIIALYLLIPYITHDQLDQGMPVNMPKLNLEDKFVGDIKLNDLRNAICHSFVSVEKNGGMIIDDRAIKCRNKHAEQEIKTENIRLNIDAVNHRLKELHNEVIKLGDSIISD